MNKSSSFNSGHLKNKSFQDKKSQGRKIYIKKIIK